MSKCKVVGCFYILISTVLDSRLVTKDSELNGDLHSPAIVLHLKGEGINGGNLREVQDKKYTQS
jgi:hypothetical protein